MSIEQRVTDWRKFWLIPCIIVSVSLVMYFFVGGTPSREWNQTNGETVVGAFQRMEHGKVVIRDEGRDLVEIAWDDLSEDDHTYLRGQLEQKTPAEFFPEQSNLTATPEQEEAGLEVWTDREGNQILAEFSALTTGNSVAVFVPLSENGEIQEKPAEGEEDERKTVSYIYEYINSDGQKAIQERTKTTGELGTLNYTLFCILHFLEFAIWGAWYVVLGNFLETRGFNRKEIGRVYGTMAIGAMISPMFLGLVADKYFATQVVIGGLHLIGAVLLFTMSKLKDPRPFYWATLAYALAYSPTLGLVNSIVFAKCSAENANVEQYFPLIRVFGTIGWIMAGLSHRFLIKKDEPMNERPILLAATLSLILGLFAFALPHTPPGGSAFSFSEFFGQMFKLVGDVPIFLAVTLVIAMSMGTYFAFGALFVEKNAGVKPNDVGSVMAIGQFVEIGFMLALPWFLSELGMSMVLTIGVTAWALRFGLFSIGKPLALILIGIGLHGICFDFFFAAGFIHIEQVASPEIRNSAQGLFAFLVYGLGLLLGTEAAGWLNQHCTKEATGDGSVPPKQPATEDLV